MRLIDADELKVHISELILVYSGTELDNAILNAIDNAPTVEPDCLHCKQYQGGYDYGFNIGYNKGKKERPQGEWIRRKMNWYICSNCNHKTDSIGETFFNFCPNCGAKMKGGAE